ncbi:hypothetical protein NicSoilB8_19630 [Arthrobacter sp. NicSoilB8]|nr:hypothetical protein NicSoilB8_19630 [Arthrobacter sp. NicSoilB8]
MIAKTPHRQAKNTDAVKIHQKKSQKSSQKLICLSCSQTCVLISGTAYPSALPVEGMTIVGVKPGMDLTHCG